MQTPRGSEGSREKEGCLEPPSLSPIMRSTELLQKSGKKGIISMSSTSSSPTLEMAVEVFKEDAEDPEDAKHDSSALLTKRRSTRATRSAPPQNKTEQDEVTSHVPSASSSKGSSRASAQHERMMELLENTQKVLSDNERLRLMLEKQKHPFARLEVQRDLLARKCADFEDSQRKMKREFEQMQQVSKNIIIGLKEQADEHATQVQTLHSEFAMHMASLKDRCTQIESQLHESASINVASAKQMLEVEQQRQLLKAKQMVEIAQQRQMLEDEHKVKALEKRNKELQAVSSEVCISFKNCSLLP